MRNLLRSTWLLWLLPAALLTASAVAPDAHATTYRDIAYAVHFEGTGTFKKLDHYDYGNEWAEEEADVQFGWSGDLNDGVVFRNGHPFDTSADDIPDAWVSGTWTNRGSDGSPLVCPADEPQPAHGLMRLTEPELAPLDGETHIYLRPFEQLAAMFDCGGSFPGVDLYSTGSLGEDGLAAPGEHTFDYEFSLPQEVFGMGYIEQLIPTRTFEGPEKCPHFYDHATTRCKLEWSGKVTFRKLWENTIHSDGQPVPPSTGPGHVPAPVTPAPKAAPPKKPAPLDDEDFLVPLVEPGDVKLDAKGTTATVDVTCPMGCSGDVELVPLVAKASAAAKKKAKKKKVKPLARKRFTAKPGKRTTVRLKLGKKARKVLRRQRRATLRLTYTKPVRRTQTMTLKLRRR